MPSVACDYGACSAPRAPGQPTGEVRRICVRRASAPRPLSRLEGCAACTRSNAVAHAWTSAARGIHGDLDDLGAGDAGVSRMRAGWERYGLADTLAGT